MASDCLASTRAVTAEVTREANPAGSTVLVTVTSVPTPAGRSVHRLVSRPIHAGRPSIAYASVEGSRYSVMRSTSTVRPTWTRRVVPSTSGCAFSTQE